MALAKLFLIGFGSSVPVDVMSTWAIQNLNLNTAIKKIINSAIWISHIEIL